MKTLLEHRQDLRFVTAYPTLRRLLKWSLALLGGFSIITGVFGSAFLVSTDYFDQAGLPSIILAVLLYILGGPLLAMLIYAIQSIAFDIADATLNTSRASTMHANALASDVGDHSRRQLAKELLSEQEQHDGQQ